MKSLRANMNARYQLKANVARQHQLKEQNSYLRKSAKQGKEDLREESRLERIRHKKWWQ